MLNQWQAMETSVPSNDSSGALDNNSNLTIDFGFLVPCEELTCIAKSISAWMKTVSIVCQRKMC
ncbi:MAG: hypothetical protein IPF93_22245 [Saprospiraceae bacterium]|nr:hypothetical protein [Saprospiraceae bacterium]